MPRNALLSPEQIEVLSQHHDPDELVDVLRLSVEDLVEAFPEHVQEAYNRGDLPELEALDD